MNKTDAPLDVKQPAPKWMKILPPGIKGGVNWYYKKYIFTNSFLPFVHLLVITSIYGYYSGHKERSSHLYYIYHFSLLFFRGEKGRSVPQETTAVAEL